MADSRTDEATTTSDAATDGAAGGDASPSKAELQRQMEEARENISETVTEIKEIVSNQYEVVADKFETVKDTVTEVLDWREKFKENPVVWGAGAVSVGILVGLGLAHSYGGDAATSSRRRQKSDLTKLAETLLTRLSGIGDAVLPVISHQVKEMFGIDLSDYLHPPAETTQLAPRRAATKRRTAAKKRPADTAATKRTRKTAAKKSSKRKSGAT